jgi:hypothetical protein
MASPSSNVSPTSRVPPPMLLGVVVGAGPADAARAHKASAQLERVGREFQHEWVRAGGRLDSVLDDEAHGDGAGHSGGWRHGFGGGGGGVAAMGLGVDAGAGPRRQSARPRQFDADSDDSDAS